MASVQTSSYGGRYLKLTVTEESTSIENNTSTVKWVLESIGGSSNYYNIYSCEVKINNITKYGPVTKTWESREFPAAKGSTSGTVDIEHNSDGTASPLSFSLRGSVYNNNPQTYSGTLTLSTIPRASSITVNDANIGSATNIVINKASSGFTTTLYYKASGQSNWTKIVDKTSNQVYGWTVPTSFYALIPNSKTISCQFYAETYSGSTLVGTSSTVTATFTATGSPVINSCLLESIDSTTVNLVGSNRMIRYVSTVRATVNASGQNSASISSIRVNGVTATNGVVTFPNATTYNYDVSVTDSRGYTTERNNYYGITWTNYIPLTLNATIVRNQPTDGNVKISYNGNYYNGSFRTSSDTYIANTLTVQYRSRIKNGTWGDWTNLSPTVSGNTYSQTTTISGYLYTNQYDFEIRAIDKVQTMPITGIVVSKGKPIFNWDDDLFNVNGDIYQNDVLLDNIYLKQASTIDSNKVTISAFNSGGKVANALQYWTDSTSNYLEKFKTYVLSSSVSAGTTLITCNFNGQHLTAIVEKANSNYLSFILFNYGQLKHFRYLNGTWYEETILKDNDITYGSNANGSWIKYPDGTMICYQRFTITTAVNINWGQLKVSETQTPPNFPVAFTTIPSVNITAEGPLSVFVINGGTNTTTSKPTTFNLAGAVAINSTTYTISITAIGRWK